MITTEQVKALPESIGLYLFKNKSGYLYIGKSLNIQERVRNHIERIQIDAKENAIYTNSEEIEYIICSSELHALVLESELIQKYLPPYNIIWKDNKSYLYIKIPMRDPYPRVQLVRREQDGKSLYFGPFSSSRDVRFLLRSIRKVVPFCMQKQPHKKPCFYSKIGLCDPCPGGEQTEDTKRLYRKQIRMVIRILKGDAEVILKTLRKQMDVASKNEKYEEAIAIRNRLLSLEQLIHLRSFEQFEYSTAYDPENALHNLHLLLNGVLKTEEIALKRIECYDISNLMQQEATASMVVATDGILDKSQYRKFKIKQTGVSDFKMLTEAIIRRMKNDWPRPDLLIVDGGTPQVVTIDKVLRSLGLTIPLIGIAKHPDRIVAYANGDTKTFRISSHNEGFKLIQQLRDESHRFAKKYHTHLRGKKFKAP